MQRRDFLKAMGLGAVAPFLAKLWHGDISEERVDCIDTPLLDDEAFFITIPHIWTTLGRFTAPVAGVYHVSGQVHFPPSNWSKYVRIWTDDHYRTSVQNPFDSGPLGWSEIIPMNKNQEVELRVLQMEDYNMMVYSDLKTRRIS